MKNHYRAPQTGKYGNIIGILKEMFNLKKQNSSLDIVLLT